MLIDRYFTDEYQTIEDVLSQDFQWEISEVTLPGGGTMEAEFPLWWTPDARSIVASKYFKVINGEPETSVKQVITRIVNTLSKWGLGIYTLSNEDYTTFRAELAYILLHQHACFNSPILFNVGVPGREQQVSACFLTDVEDTMESILEHGVTEGLIFKGGSGSGVNVSKLRPAGAPLSAGGTSSGPISFMRGWDSMANAIKSGGTTRRAARMVVMNADHPNINGFINTKPLEELKAQALVNEGYDGGIDGEARDTVSFQNANHSVLISDDFMAKATTDETSDEHHVLKRIAEAAWMCGDPGLLFSDAINKFHTTPQDGAIYVTNPCSEFMHHPFTSCNLSSIDLAKVSKPFTKDVDGPWMTEFRHIVSVMMLAQDIAISGGDYPTEQISEQTWRYRPIGIGFTNLGGFLMRESMAYDSDEARGTAKVITQAMTLFAYDQSERLADAVGPFPAYNEQEMLNALKSQVYNTENDIFSEWTTVLERAENNNGFRNSYVTNIAPVGTISYWMDNETTGIEPEIGLVKQKALVGGGVIGSVSRAVERKIRADHYNGTIAGFGRNADEIINDIRDSNRIPDYFDRGYRRMFLTALPDADGEALSPGAHISMLAAVQPYLSGGISKTVNCPSSYTQDDIYNLYVTAWQLGLKSLAVYRDGSKIVQPVTVGTKDTETGVHEPKPGSIVLHTPLMDNPIDGRRKLPNDVRTIRHKFKLAGVKGYIHVGEFEDGHPAELFLNISQQGSTIDGWADSFAKAVSLLFQMGVPIDELSDFFIGVNFEPSGFTSNTDIPTATSIVDYVFKWLKGRYSIEMPDHTEPGYMRVEVLDVPKESDTPYKPLQPVGEGQAYPQLEYKGEVCRLCGGIVKRAGNCWLCETCGETSGGC